jgi:hypothetical protein
MSQVLLCITKYVCGWPRNDDARAAVVDIGEMLAYRYETDAHFAAYASNLDRRVTIDVHRPEHAGRTEELGLRMVLAVFDCDGPDHVCTDEWWADEKRKVAELLRVHPGAFVYRTRGGYRIVYALPEPFPLRTKEDDASWTARYRTWIRYLLRRFSIRADAACADWTRLYRCPHARREGVIQDLEWIGDRHALGTWAPTLAKGDVIAARRPAKEQYGVVEPIPIADPESPYGVWRIAQAVRYLEHAPLSIKGEGGRTKMFRVCTVLVRRMRLPLDVAADLVEVIYCDRLRSAGTAVWSRSEPGPHGMSIEERLVKARDTSHIPPGDVPTEEEWLALRSMGRAS